MSLYRIRDSLARNKGGLRFTDFRFVRGNVPFSPDSVKAFKEHHPRSRFVKENEENLFSLLMGLREKVGVFFLTTQRISKKQNLSRSLF